MISLITQAVAILKAGGLVAFPTETVYGLGADATNAAAIQKIFRAKERPYDHPLIVHVAKIAQIEEWAKDISPAAFKLAETFWPGPLTMILKKRPQVLNSVTGNQETVGLRIPRHPIAQALLQAFQGGIAAPSANKFTHISPTTARAVQEELGKEVDLILDGGTCEVGLESTIIDMSGKTPLILRPGMITAAEIAKVLGMAVAIQTSSQHRVPGQHHLHYAPTTKTIRISSQFLFTFLDALKEEDLPIACVAYSDQPIEKKGVRWIKMPSDATQYAHDLYHTLRELDHQHFKQIVLEEVPEEAEWTAIADRILKASGSV